MGNRWQLRVTRPEGQAGAQLGEGSYPHIHRIKPPPPPDPTPLYRHLICRGRGGMTTNGIHFNLPLELSNPPGPPQPVPDRRRAKSADSFDDETALLDSERWCSTAPRYRVASSCGARDDHNRSLPYHFRGLEAPAEIAYQKRARFRVEGQHESISDRAFCRNSGALMRKSGRENKRTDLSLRYFVGYAVRASVAPHSARIRSLMRRR